MQEQPPVPEHFDLNVIAENPAVVPAVPDKESKGEIDDEQRLHNVGLDQDIKERKKYAFRIFLLVAFWITAVLVIIILQGFSVCGFHLSDSILLAAIGSTTANVIGILIIVIKYLFSEKGKA